MTEMINGFRNSLFSIVLLLFNSVTSFLHNHPFTAYSATKQSVANRLFYSLNYEPMNL